MRIESYRGFGRSVYVYLCDCGAFLMASTVLNENNAPGLCAECAPKQLKQSAEYCYSRSILLLELSSIIQSDPQIIDKILALAQAMKDGKPIDDIIGLKHKKAV